MVAFAEASFARQACDGDAGGDNSHHQPGNLVFSEISP
jgi:hypothetical protein